MLIRTAGVTHPGALSNPCSAAWNSTIPRFTCETEIALTDDSAPWLLEVAGLAHSRQLRENGGW